MEEDLVHPDDLTDLELMVNHGLLPPNPRLVPAGFQWTGLEGEGADLPVAKTLWKKVVGTPECQNAVFCYLSCVYGGMFSCAVPSVWSRKTLVRQMVPKVGELMEAGGTAVGKGIAWIQRLWIGIEEGDVECVGPVLDDPLVLRVIQPCVEAMTTCPGEAGVVALTAALQVIGGLGVAEQVDVYDAVLTSCPFDGVVGILMDQLRALVVRNSWLISDRVARIPVDVLKGVLDSQEGEECAMRVSAAGNLLYFMLVRSKGKGLAFGENAKAGELLLDEVINPVLSKVGGDFALEQVIARLRLEK